MWALTQLCFGFICYNYIFQIKQKPDCDDPRKAFFPPLCKRKSGRRQFRSDTMYPQWYLHSGFIFSLHGWQRTFVLLIAKWLFHFVPSRKRRKISKNYKNCFPFLSFSLFPPFPVTSPPLPSSSFLPFSPLSLHPSIPTSLPPYLSLTSLFLWDECNHHCLREHQLWWPHKTCTGWALRWLVSW